MAEGPIDSHPLVKDTLALRTQHLDGTLPDPNDGVVGNVGRFQRLGNEVRRRLINAVVGKTRE